MLKKRWRKRLGLVALTLTVFGLPLAFGLSNLLLMSAKGRSFVAARVQRVIHLETSVQGCTWSPWNGFTVYGLLIKQPAPLGKAISKPILTAESIRIHPEWRALLGKRLVIRGIDIQRPDLVLAIELLSQIPSAPVEQSVAVKPPDLAAAGQSTGGIVAAPNTLPAPAKKPPASPPQASHVVTAPTVWVNFTNARLNVVSTLSKAPLYQISRMDGRLPISGKKAGSELVLDGIKMLGNAIPSAVKIPVKWQAPVLNFESVNAGFFGIDCKLQAQIVLTPGIPFLISGIVPKQDDKEMVFSEALHAKLGSIAGQGRFQGHVLAPGSWQGQWLFQTLSMDAEYAGNKLFFNHGHGLMMFQHGILRCLDARLIGDDISFLSNGMAMSDGKFAANLRIVATPESLAIIAKRTRTDSASPQLTPLSTPQRAALDIRAFGFPGRVFYQPNPAAKPILIR